MTSIPVEQLGERLGNALKEQDEREAIGLTTESGTVAWVLRVPKALQDSKAEVVLLDRWPGGVVVIMQATHEPQGQLKATGKPVFGALRGALTIISEDDDHLKDFQEYME